MSTDNIVRYVQSIYNLNWKNRDLKTTPKMKYHKTNQATATIKRTSIEYVKKGNQVKVNWEIMKLDNIDRVVNLTINKPERIKELEDFLKGYLHGS